jgi:hypothetical protein
MGFKKAGAKKKVKKAPGKKGRKDGWDFEGGQFTDDSKKSEIDSSVGPDGSILKKRGPRKTQERDEYIRRGKAKIEDRKRKGQFEKKMSKKMRFGDTLRDELIEKTETTYVGPVEAVEKKRWQKSTKSVMERLQSFVKTDLARSLTSRVKSNAIEEIDEAVIDEDDPEVDHEGEEEYEMDAKEYEDLNADDLDENEVENEDRELEDDLDDDDDADGEEEAGSDTDDDVKDSPHESIRQDDFDWIFNPQSQVASLMVNDKVAVEKPTDRNNLQKLAAFDDFQLYGALHPKVAGHRRTPVKRCVILSMCSLP